MRKTAYFALSVLTFYLSAMYRSMPLIMLFLAEMLLAVCMWILSCYLKKHFAVTISEQSVVAEMGEEYWCGCDICNRGRLPVNRFRICVKIRYLQETRGSIKFLYGASGSGTDRIRFRVHAPYCGLVCLKFHRIRVYDYLALFSRGSALRQEMRISILPPEKPLLVDMSASWWGSGDMGQDKTNRCNGDATDEVRQIREYRAGDSYRHIHWNQSAKTDRIWIKEYEKEANPCVDFLLEIQEAQWKKPKDMDAFYRLLCSIILGLLQKAGRVKVYWYDGHPDRLMEMDVPDGRQCRDLLLRLYQMDLPGQADTAAEKLLESYPLSHDRYFKLDSELYWYLNTSLIYHFSGENLEQEMADKVFTL